MTYINDYARIEFDGTGELLIGWLAGITDVVSSHAEDVKNLKRAFYEAVDDYLQTRAKLGKKPEKPFSGCVMFQVDPEIHARAVLATGLPGQSLNQWAEAVLRQAAGRRPGADVPSTWRTGDRPPAAA